MSKVQFHEAAQEVSSTRTTSRSSASSMAKFLVQHGIVGSVKTASVLLIIIAIALLILAFWFWPHDVGTTPELPPEPNATGHTPPVLTR